MPSIKTAKKSAPASAVKRGPAVSAPAKSAPAKKDVAAPRATSEKTPKQRLKLVRDSFTMPATDFALIATLKARALSTQREAKKSELLRAGLHALATLAPAALVKALDALAPIKVGRPKKNV
jgi:hypothetical protein